MELALSKTKLGSLKLTVHSSIFKSKGHKIKNSSSAKNRACSIIGGDRMLKISTPVDYIVIVLVSLVFALDQTRILLRKTGAILNFKIEL